MGLHTSPGFWKLRICNFQNPGEQSAPRYGTTFAPGSSRLGQHTSFALMVVAEIGVLPTQRTIDYSSSTHIIASPRAEMTMPQHPDALPPVSPANSPLQYFLKEVWRGVGGGAEHLEYLTFSASGSLPSAFAVTDLACATVGAAGLAVAEWVHATSGHFPPVKVDRRLASFWFESTLRPEGWSLPSRWDAVAGDYRASDGWIRLHTNAPHHRAAALAVLGAPADKVAVTAAVANWRAGDLETAVVDNGGCAAMMYSLKAWERHPQGQAVLAEPLMHRQSARLAAKPGCSPVDTRPLAGIRVLDLTRILAGPVATRFLAGFGAEVLRIDPPHWEEPGIAEVSLGKRCARLDLKNAQGREQLEHLLAQADVLVHGYRPEALARLGLDPVSRRRINPSLVDISLDAYGWTGPWRGRRGFDSLVQMSAGIAEAGMLRSGRDRPTPLPVQALDHATGYMMAAAAIRGLTERLTQGTACANRTSLARVASLLATCPVEFESAKPPLPASLSDYTDDIELSAWGPARRLRPPVTIAGLPMYWDRPATKLGSSPARW